MKEMETMVLSLVEDREMLKWRLNLIRGNTITGCLKPI